MSDIPEQQPKQNNIPENTPERLMQELHAGVSELRAAKADIDIVRSSKIEIDQLKSEINQAKGAVDADLASISEAKDNFSSLRQQATTQSTQAKNKLDALNAEIAELEKTKETLTTVVDELNQLKTAASQQKDSVNSDVENINETKNQFENLRSEAQNIHSDLTGRQTDAQNKISEIENIHEKIDELFSELLEDEKDEEGKITQESKKRQILQLQNDISEIFSTIQNDREDALSAVSKLKRTLEDEIRSLLPKAGAAGLSGAYVQAKSRYGTIPFDKKAPTKHEAFLSWLWHQATHRAPTFVYYTMFIAPLIFMTWWFYDLFKDLSNPLPDGSTPTRDDVLLFVRVSLAIPLGIISLFGWSSIRLNRRLYEEYNHKQRVMQLYHSFKDEIDVHGNEEHKKALLAVMLKAVDDKPSLTMHKYDKGFESLIPTIGIGSLLSLGKKDD